MKKIDREKYSKIKKLLQSANKGDILIGISLLKKSDFTYEDYVKSFPNNRDDGEDFVTKYDEFFWVTVPYTFLAVDCGMLYAPRKSQESVKRWRKDFPDEEIKL